MDRKRVLITGGTGRLARNWAAAICSEFQVLLADRRRTESLLQAQHMRVDLGDKRALTRQILDGSPDIVVHASGLANVEMCEANHGLSNKVNVIAATNVADVCAFLGISLIHISTDHLFSSGAGWFLETDVPQPLNVYARSKALAESSVLDCHPDALILRTNFFGHAAPGRQSMSSWILSTLQAREPVRLFSDVFFTPVLASNLARDAMELVRMGAKGIFNIASKDRVSKYEFGMLLCEEFGLDKNLVVSESIDNRSDLVNRPHEMSLSGLKSELYLGRSCKSVGEHIRDLRIEDDLGLGRLIVKNRTPYGRHQVSEPDIAAVSTQMRVGSLTQGETITEFERAVANRVNAEYAVAVSSGTAGLHLALLAADLNSGSRAITSAVSFASSANAARFFGAEVDFADIDRKTLNMTPETLKATLGTSGGQLDAVVAVHMAGLSANMQGIRSIASASGAAVIEDAAHALGGHDADGNPVGSCSHSDMTVFSLHPVKTIAAGEGGVVTTNSRDLYRRLLRLRSHGINKELDTMTEAKDPITGDEITPWRYEMLELGFNYRLTDVQAALALSQLNRLDDFVSRRRELACLYDSEFKDHDLVKPYHQAWRSFSAHHLYIVDIGFDRISLSRGELMRLLSEEGFVTQVHYLPIPAHPYYREAGYGLGNVPNATSYYRGALSIPLYVDLSDGEARRFAATLKGLVDGNRT